MANNNGRNYVAQSEMGLEVSSPMRSFKEEVAAEIGLHNYDKMDKGWLASRQNGYVGGNMTKKMVAYAEQAINEQGTQALAGTKTVLEVSPEVRQLNEMASKNYASFINAVQNGVNFQQISQQAGGDLH